MVSMSQETPEQVEARLRGVIRRARLTVFDEPYGFKEFPLVDFPAAVSTQALALVRDDAVWSQLVPVDPSRHEEVFRLFRFHFPAGVQARLKSCFTGDNAYLADVEDVLLTMEGMGQWRSTRSIGRLRPCLRQQPRQCH